MFEFNQSQLEALDLKEHVVLTAAAGSGKTSVLVERFVRILEINGFEPAKIVAITFTEEAAAEMRQRIGEAIQSRARHFEGPDPNPWLPVLRHLSRASITTIHGFCLRLLQSNFESIDLDPDTRLLSPMEQPVLLADCLAEFLLNAAKQRDEDLAILLQVLPLPAIQSCLTELVNRRNSFQRIAGSESGLTTLLKGYQEEACHWILTSPEWDFLSTTLQSLPRTLLAAPGTMSERCRGQLAGLEQQGKISDLEVIQSVEATLHQRYAPSKIWKESTWREEVTKAWTGLRNILARHPLDFESPDAETESWVRSSSAALKTCYQRVLGSYKRRKKSMAAIDFEDILDYARELLLAPDQRRKFQRRYPFLLVDEFQDTNQIQWQIVRSLIGPQSNFMAVGDDKQSIYRFRQADVAVFREVRRWGKRRGKRVEMPENYRSDRKLVEFTNQVFRKLFSGGVSYEAVHQEMKVAGSRKGEGKVEAFFTESERQFSDAARVAAWIARLLEEGRAASEIAILLRNRNRLKLYEEALASRQIPFATVAGSGFFESQEILDCIVLLRWLENPQSEIELAGLLRSPFLNLSDEQLLALSRAPGETFSEKVLHSSLPASADDPIQFARSVLRHLRTAAETGQPPSRLLAEALRLTGYEQILATSRQASVRLGNLQKFQRLLVDFESRRSRSLRASLRFLDGVLASRVTEAEATVPEGKEEGVRIYTIHGAKGLEFPVVILPELGQPFSDAPSEPLYLIPGPVHEQQEAHLGLLIWNPTDHYRKLEHPLYRVLEKLDAYRRLAEEKRLLYVALTRCREHLILLGNRSSSDSCASWLWDCGVELYQVQYPFLSQTEERKQSSELEFLSLDDVSEEDLFYQVAARPEPLPSRSVWTPTRITDFLQCPRRFYLSDIKGVPEEPSLSLHPPESEPAQLGTIVHEILELQPLLEDWSMVEKLVLLHVSRMVPSGEQERLRLQSRILSHLRQTRDHPVFDRVTNAEIVYSERRFLIQQDGRQIEGVIDKLCREASGAWLVMDFKTNVPPRPAADWPLAMLQAREQLAIYLWAVSEILSPDKLEGLLLFTSTGEVERIPWNPEVRAQVEDWLRLLPGDERIENYPKTTVSLRCEDCPYRLNGHCSGRMAIQQSLW